MTRELSERNKIPLYCPQSTVAACCPKIIYGVGAVTERGEKVSLFSDRGVQSKDICLNVGNIYIVFQGLTMV